MQADIVRRAVELEHAWASGRSDDEEDSEEKDSDSGTSTGAEDVGTQEPEQEPEQERAQVVVVPRRRPRAATAEGSAAQVLTVTITAQAETERQDLTRVTLMGVVEKLVTDEQRVCPDCGSRRLLRYGPFGPYFRCMADGCGNTASVAVTVLTDALKALVATCDECGAPLKIAKGPRGHFIGCSGYPKHRKSFPWREL